MFYVMYNIEMMPTYTMVSLLSSHLYLSHVQKLFLHSFLNEYTSLFSSTEQNYLLTQMIIIHLFCDL